MPSSTPEVFAPMVIITFLPSSFSATFASPPALIALFLPLDLDLSAAHQELLLAPGEIEILAGEQVVLAPKVKQHRCQPPGLDQFFVSSRSML
jgi:hypothetical protein